MPVGVVTAHASASFLSSADGTGCATTWPSSLRRALRRAGATDRLVSSCSSRWRSSTPSTVPGLATADGVAGAGAGCGPSTTQGRRVSPGCPSITNLTSTQSSSGSGPLRSRRPAMLAAPRAVRAAGLLPHSRSALRAMATSMGTPFQWVSSAPSVSVSSGPTPCRCVASQAHRSCPGIQQRSTMKNGRRTTDAALRGPGAV